MEVTCWHFCLEGRIELEWKMSVTGEEEGGGKEKTQDQDGPLTCSQVPKILNITGEWEWKLAFIE